MAISGVIYKQGKTHSGSVEIWKIVRIFKRIGLGLVLTGVFILLMFFSPVFVNELDYALNKPLVDESAILAAQDTASVQYEAQSLGVDSHFSIYIPKIDVGSNILANIDAGVEEEYSQALKQGIAHAKGTSFPGMGENIFVFSHSTDFDFNVERFNAKFYLLNKLEAGDNIIVYFSDKKYIYTVTDKKIVSPENTSALNPTGEEVLTLQTCYPPGTSLKRLIIQAIPYEKQTNS